MRLLPSPSGHTLAEALDDADPDLHPKPCCRSRRRRPPHRLRPHITGGGLIENPPRAIAQGLVPRFDWSAWTAPPVFAWLAETGGVDEAEMRRTFNCGLGLLLIASPRDAEAVLTALLNAGETAFAVRRAHERALSDQPCNGAPGASGKMRRKLGLSGVRTSRLAEMSPSPRSLPSSRSSRQRPDRPAVRPRPRCAGCSRWRTGRGPRSAGRCGHRQDARHRPPRQHVVIGVKASW